MVPFLESELYLALSVNRTRVISNRIGFSKRVLHCASLTAHNKIAAVKKSMCRNIIKMKLTEEKRFWNFCLQLFFAEVRLNVLGMCIM